MTPDRNDQTPLGDAENGVLGDSASIDTTAIGIIGVSTAQVSVSLPLADDSDDSDDSDIVGDEVPYVIELGAPDEGDVPEIDESEEDAGETRAVESPVSRDADVPTIDTADVFVIEVASPEPALYVVDESVVELPEVAAHEADDAEPAVEAVAVEPHTPDDEIDEPAPEPVEDDALADAESTVADAIAEAEASVAESVARAEASVAEAMAAKSAPAELAVEAEPAVEEVVATPAAASPTTPVPATRWQAHHPDSPDRPDRAHAVERVTPRTEVTLSSKRLGEFEANRESADLLTADRLLDPHQVVRPEPEGAWQHFVYSLSGKRINLGDGKRARARKDLDRRIAAPLIGGARFVPVVSRKGGVGKTTVTTLLGMALADARDDRIIAVDANPDRGTLADRIAKSGGKTVRDLVRTRAEVVGFNDISKLVARDETRLDVVASDSDPRVSEAFSDRDYHDVATLAAHYYSIVLTDTGTGIVHSVMGATLELADQIVVVAGLSVDEARLASETLTWLETNGYAEQVRNAVVVLNTARPGAPLVRPDELERHFRTRARAVVRMPYDAHIAAGSAISFRDLQPATRDAARELAAAVVEGLRALAPAA